MIHVSRPLSERETMNQIGGALEQNIALLAISGVAHMPGVKE
jgi:hypothetical protein